MVNLVVINGNGTYWRRRRRSCRPRRRRSCWQTRALSHSGHHGRTPKEDCKGRTHLCSWYAFAFYIFAMLFIVCKRLRNESDFPLNWSFKFLRLLETLPKSCCVNSKMYCLTDFPLCDPAGDAAFDAGACARNLSCTRRQQCALFQSGRCRSRGVSVPGRRVQVGALSPRGLPDVRAQSSVHHQDIPPQHWQARQDLLGHTQRFVQGVPSERRPGLVWLWFLCFTILPSCQAASAKFPSALAELGIRNQSQENPVSAHFGHPV